MVNENGPKQERCGTPSGKEKLFETEPLRGGLREMRWDLFVK